MQYDTVPPPPLERHALPELKHSGLGIASFVISLMIGVALFALLAVAGFQEMQSPGTMDEESPLAMLIGLLVIGALMVSLVGVALGIATMVQKNRKKIFGVLGLAFNLLIILGTGALMIIGSTME